MKWLIVVAVTVLSCIANATGQACPKIISRSAWGARAPTSSSPLTTSPTPYTVVHHAASAACTTQSSCTALVKSFQNQHIDVNGWADIGYSFLIGEDGNVYEGRGWDKVGAHAPGYNSNSIGICMIGTFTSHLPNAAALATLKQLIACGVGLGKIRSNYGLIGHRQATSTECPGNSLYAHIKTWDHWVNV